ncbi:methylated-DNA--[protein]-cysteine S-methyltransferase [Petrotoga sp. 9PWA.NaAc.5.4]|uniref:methylated-DNA--[protein]-cysteine S-methyltransferase n=1 Tax=Petrotoga sp. 9PWA.NaAc.5.4 TaxID=1434328 RepID=UPI000CB9175E|nr:MGMT family protein [Petrotoga sp. 9PWA.NaAc.5.4]PNR95288.1 methylated-DNA--protein-cysteine methyltransferase [Petrotoga sp. 9PWA.NaAc.5.4]
MKFIIEVEVGSIVVFIENTKITKVHLKNEKLGNKFDKYTKTYFELLYNFLFGDLERVPEEFFVLPGKTVFAKKVYQELYNTKKGCVLTYKELAIRSENPKAYRAVGSLMKNNPLPIIIPCHRVIKSDGNIGNYSSGVAWKIFLLNIEKRHNYRKEGEKIYVSK